MSGDFPENNNLDQSMTDFVDPGTYQMDYQVQGFQDSNMQFDAAWHPNQHPDHFLNPQFQDHGPKNMNVDATTWHLNQHPDHSPNREFQEFNDSAQSSMTNSPYSTTPASSENLPSNSGVLYVVAFRSDPSSSNPASASNSGSNSPQVSKRSFVDLPVDEFAEEYPEDSAASWIEHAKSEPFIPRRQTNNGPRKGLNHLFLDDGKQIMSRVMSDIIFQTGNRIEEKTLKADIEVKKKIILQYDTQIKELISKFMKNPSNCQSNKNLLKELDQLRKQNKMIRQFRICVCRQTNNCCPDYRTWSMEPTEPPSDSQTSDYQDSAFEDYGFAELDDLKAAASANLNIMTEKLEAMKNNFVDLMESSDVCKVNRNLFNSYSNETCQIYDPVYCKCKITGICPSYEKVKVIPFL